MKKYCFMILLGVGLLVVIFNQRQIRFERDTLETSNQVNDVQMYAYDNLGFPVLCNVATNLEVSVSLIIDLYTNKANQLSLGCNTPLIMSSRLVDYHVIDNTINLVFDKKMYHFVDDLKLVSKTLMLNMPISGVYYRHPDAVINIL